jgi:hypothetical protein
MTDHASLRQHWHAVIDSPLNYVQPAHFAPCFADALSAEQLNALLAQPRYAGRLQKLLMQHFALAPLAQPPREADIPLLLMPAEQFPRVTLLCGATWHGNTLVREIRGAAVQTLKQTLGSDVFDYALAHRSQAGAVDLHLDVDQLLQAITRDGQACIGAWVRTLPEALQGWLRLRLDAQWLAADDFSASGIDLLRAIAAKEFSA